MRLVIVAVFAAVVWLASNGRRSRSDRRNSLRYPQEHSEPSEGERDHPQDSLPQRTVPPESAHHHGQAYQAEHPFAERFYWIASSAGTISAAVAAGVAVWYAAHAYYAARDQADIAQRTLIASERPWVMLTDIKPVSLASDDKAGVDLSVELSVKNVGHSPAQNVTVSGSRLLVEDFDPPASQAMVSVCQEQQNSSFVVPGQLLFPDQVQNVEGDRPSRFWIEADKVWAARTARIKSAYDNRIAFGGDKQRARKEADALAEFPFYAPLQVVGCINYHSSDNKSLYQTSFTFDIRPKEPYRAASFPLLGGVPPVIRYPEPEPGDPDTLMVFPRELQRIVPGDQIKLGTPFYGAFAR